MYRGLEWLSRRAMWVAGFCYLLITVLICFDIFARKFLGFSTESTIELTGYLMAVGMSWGLAGTLFERGHVRIDVLVQRMPLRVRVWLRARARGPDRGGAGSHEDGTPAERRPVRHRALVPAGAH